MRPGRPPRSRPQCKDCEAPATHTMDSRHWCCACFDLAMENCANLRFDLLALADPTRSATGEEQRNKAGPQLALIPAP